MTPVPKEIEKMIEEYADYLCPDDKLSHEAVSTDTYGFVARLLDTHCFVSKEQLLKRYAAVKQSFEAVAEYSELAAGTLMSQLTLLKDLYGDELFEADELK